MYYDEKSCVCVCIYFKIREISVWYYILEYFFYVEVFNSGAFLLAQMVKNLPAMQETQVQSLGQEDPLEKGIATNFSILAWRIPWTEEPGGLKSMGLQRVGDNWMANTFAFTLEFCRARKILLKGWRYSLSYSGAGYTIVKLHWAIHVQFHVFYFMPLMLPIKYYLQKNRKDTPVTWNNSLISKFIVLVEVPIMSGIHKNTSFHYKCLILFGNPICAVS